MPAQPSSSIFLGQQIVTLAAVATRLGPHAGVCGSLFAMHSPTADWQHLGTAVEATGQPVHNARLALGTAYADETLGKRWRSREEKHAIEDIESAAALLLGEPMRASHAGAPGGASGVGDHRK